MSQLVAPIFGLGTDADLVISSNTTDAPIDSAFTGSSGAVTGSGTNVSFAAGQLVFIHQTTGTGYGQCERNVITGYTAGTITFSNPLSYTYVSGAQILVLKQYRSITINSGFILSAKAWNGTVGGILAYLCSGRTNIVGTISAGLLSPGGGYSTSNQGFRGATTAGGQGEGVGGLGALNSVNTVANGTGGGGGNGTSAGAGGGGHSASGTTGNATSGTPGVGGSSSGSTDLLTMTFGGGGGRGGGTSGEGGPGGGIVIIMSPTIIIDASTGFIKSNGSDGQAGSVGGAGGGGGAGGSILLVCKYATLGTGRVLAQGGLGGTTSGGGNGGPGADGRIAIARGSILDAGTSTPTYTDRGYQTYCGSVGRG